MTSQKVLLSQDIDDVYIHTSYENSALWHFCTEQSFSDTTTRGLLWQMILNDINSLSMTWFTIDGKQFTFYGYVLNGESQYDSPYHSESHFQISINDFYKFVFVYWNTNGG